MKFLARAATAILGIIFTVTTARAQAPGFSISVPFPFVVGKQTLPAGTYLVQGLQRTKKVPAETGVIVIKTSDRHIYKVAVTTDSDRHVARRAEGSKLIFSSFQGKQYLKQVLVAGDPVVHQLADVRPEIAAQGATGEVVVTAFHPK